MIFTFILLQFLGVSDASAVQSYNPRKANLGSYKLKNSSLLSTKRLEVSRPKRKLLERSEAVQPYHLKSRRQSASLVRRR